MKRFSVVLLACCVASHWVLIKIDKTSRRSSYYDSIGGYFIHVKAKVDQIILHHKESLCGPGGSPDDFQHVSIPCQKQRDGHSCGLLMLFNLECVLLGVEPGEFSVTVEMLQEKFANMIPDKHPSRVTDVQDPLENYQSFHKANISKGWINYSGTRARLDRQKKSSQILKASTPGYHSEEDNVIEIPATGSTVAEALLSQRLPPTPESTEGKGKPLWTPDPESPKLSGKPSDLKFALR